MSPVAQSIARHELQLPTLAQASNLAAERHPLCLTLLMSTVPGARMVPGDRTKLNALALDAFRRLGDDRERGAAAAICSALEDALAEALTGPTDRGLAILASPGGSLVLHLRVSPRNRVIVDPTFATRDLVRSAAEDPAFLMLVIDGRAARLLHYDQRSSRPVAGEDFPMPRPGSQRGRPSFGGDDARAPHQRSGPDRAGKERTKIEMSRAFLRDVDARLSIRAAELGIPVVLVASERTVAEFLSVAPSRRIAATVRTGNGNASISELELAGRAALAGHIRDRAGAALDTAAVRLAHGRAVAGLKAAWESLSTGDPDLLVVEHTYQAPARLSDRGLDLVEDPEEQGVLDDAVDELIEGALARGVEVVMVPAGSLARHGHLVLTLRGKASRKAG